VSPSGAPKQENLDAGDRSQLNVGAILAVGAAFDTQAGLRRRAPEWMQKIALGVVLPPADGAATLMATIT